MITIPKIDEIQVVTFFYALVNVSFFLDCSDEITAA